MLKNVFKGGKFPADLDTGITSSRHKPPRRAGAGLPIFKKGHRVGQVNDVPSVSRYSPTLKKGK